MSIPTVPHKRPGRPRGSKDTYQRTRSSGPRQPRKPGAKKPGPKPGGKRRPKPPYQFNPLDPLHPLQKVFAGPWSKAQAIAQCEEGFMPGPLETKLRTLRLARFDHAGLAESREFRALTQHNKLILLFCQIGGTS